MRGHADGQTDGRTDACANKCVLVHMRARDEQVIMEAAITRTLVFAQPHRQFLQLLFPRFCRVTSEQEFLEKLDHLEQHPEKYEELLRELDDNLHRIELNLTESSMYVDGLLRSIQEQDSRSDSRCIFDEMP